MKALVLKVVGGPLILEEVPAPQPEEKKKKSAPKAQEKSEDKKTSKAA